MQPQNPNGLCFVNTEMLLPKQMWEKQRIYICSLGKCDRQFWKITNLELEILTGLPGCNKATVIHVQYIRCHICVHAVCSACVTCDPVDCSPKGSSVHGILQARTLEWVATSFSDLPNPGINPVSPALAGGFFTTEPPGKPIAVITQLLNTSSGSESNCH